jgi:hypothetical protein
VALEVLLVKKHLFYVGSMDIKSYWDFAPSWISYEYGNNDPPTINISRFHIAHYRFFWIFNCKLYCPLSMALFRYAAYLVKIAEYWWCPFAHNRKEEYAEGAIDKSFWHAYPQELEKLHPDDCKNPIWNENGED